MSKKILRIGSQIFGSKSEAKRYIRSILLRYGDGELVSGDDEKFLLDLIRQHPEAEQKIGTGVQAFTVQLEPVWRKTRHFVLIRLDGSSTDFSFLSCLDGADKKKDVLSALRHAVSDQIVSFKSESFFGDVPLVCPYLGVPISPEEAHVDHVAPKTFRSLVDDWLKQERLSLELVSVSDPADNQWTCEMVDLTQKDSWSRFHLQWAELRITSKTANLSHAKLTH